MHRRRARSAWRSPRVCAGARQTDDDEAGFTLLEVMVALAILGMSLTVLFSVFTGALEMAHRARMKLEARNLAEALLTQAETAPVQNLHDQAGTTPGGLEWMVQVVPYGTPEDRSEWVYAPLEVLVDVQWTGIGQSREVRVSGLRLTPKPRSQ